MDTEYAELAREEANRRRKDKDTYLEKLSEEDPTYHEELTKFIQEFNRQWKTFDSEIHIRKYPVSVGKFFNSLNVEPKLFWQRYMYRTDEDRIYRRIRRGDIEIPTKNTQKLYVEKLKGDEATNNVPIRRPPGRSRSFDPTSIEEHKVLKSMNSWNVSSNDLQRKPPSRARSFGADRTISNSTKPSPPLHKHPKSSNSITSSDDDSTCSGISWVSKNSSVRDRVKHYGSVSNKFSNVSNNNSVDNVSVSSGVSETSRSVKDRMKAYSGMQAFSGFDSNRTSLKTPRRKYSSTRSGLGSDELSVVSGMSDASSRRLPGVPKTSSVRSQTSVMDFPWAKTKKLERADEKGSYAIPGGMSRNTVKTTAKENSEPVSTRGPSKITLGQSFSALSIQERMKALNENASKTKLKENSSDLNKEDSNSESKKKSKMKSVQKWFEKKRDSLMHGNGSNDGIESPRRKARRKIKADVEPTGEDGRPEPVKQNSIGRIVNKARPSLQRVSSWGRRSSKQGNSQPENDEGLASLQSRVKAYTKTFQKMDKKEATEIADLRRGLKETYSKDLYEDNMTIKERKEIADYQFTFRMTFDETEEERDQILRDHKIVAERLKGSIVSKLEFWERYFWRCDVNRIMRQAKLQEKEIDDEAKKKELEEDAAPGEDYGTDVSSISEDEDVDGCTTKVYRKQRPKIRRRMKEKARMKLERNLPSLSTVPLTGVGE